MIRTRPWRRRLLLTGALLAGLLTAPASAQEFAVPQPGDPLLVEITGLEPLNPLPSGTVTITGTVTNRGSDEATDVTAVLRVSGDPLTNRTQVAALSAMAGNRRGVPIESTATPVTEKLAPAAVAPFRVTASTGSLPLGPNGVYAIFTEVRSSAGSNVTGFPMPWFPDPGALEPSRLAVVTPIRSGVDMSATGDLLTPQLVDSVAPGGALSQYVSAGAVVTGSGIPMTWLVDPAVTAAASRLASGNGSFPDGTSAPGAGREATSSWLQTLLEGTAQPTASTYITPYAEVDGAAALSAGLPGLPILSTAVAAASPVPEVRGLLYAPPDGGTTTDALEAYADGGISTVLLDDSTLPPSEEIPYTPNGVATLRLPDGRDLTALLLDSLLTEELSKPSASPAEQFRLQSGLLAQAAMITLELPTRSRTVLMLPPSEPAIPGELYAATITALAQAPYIELVGLPALLDPQLPRVPRSPRLPASDPGQLPADYLAAVPGIQERLGAFARVAIEPLAFAADYEAALLRSASANWRAQLPVGIDLLASVGADLTVAERQVTTVSSGTVTFTGSRGTLPLTVSNGLEQAVRVGIVLQPEPAFRLAYESPGMVTVEAGRRVSVEIPVEVYGSGPIPVVVVLTDADGRPFVESSELTIRSTGASVVAAGIAGIGATALVALVLWRFRRKEPSRD